MGPMTPRNATDVSELLLRGFPSQPEVLFPLFLSIYVLALLGNVTIVLLIRSDVQLLQSPMYFLLSHLALADLGFTATIVLKALDNLRSRRNTISYRGCLVQIFFHLIFGNADNYLLACMAYDRYVAIRCPLHYSALMSHRRCLQMAMVCWVVPTLHSLLYTLLMARIKFCDPYEIPHFFCDICPMLAIACSDTTAVDMLLLTEAIVDVMGPFALVVLSYALISHTILKIPSAVGKRKAFSTCGSHICVVVLFYGTVSWVYFKPNAKRFDERDTAAAVMYTMVTPMLNPFIYSLRNSEMKAAMRRVVKQRF